MSKASVATAYVQILPTTDGLKANLSKDILPAADSAGQAGGNSFAAAFKKTIAALGIGAAVKETLDLGGALQQSIGGVETLFKDSAVTVRAYADQAFQSAGLSANAYMETVTGFSSRLLQGLSGDTKQAADIANLAVVDMADNVNKFGNSFDSVQSAYQGFAKQNYNMLDNLKLGYGGTAAEMARLINESGVLGDTVKVTADTVNDVSFDQMILAIHTIQENLKITGATAEEASTTLSGSFAAMKASAENVLANLALGESITPSMEALIQTSKNYLFDNWLPMVGNIAKGIPTALSTAIREGLPVILESGKSMLSELKNGFVANLPELLSQALPMLLEFSGEIRSNIGELVDLGIDLVLSLVDGLIAGLPDLISYVPQIVSNIAGVINDNAPKILNAGVQIIIKLISGLVSAIPDIVANMGSIMQAVMDVITAINWINLGKSIIEGIVKGLQSLATSIQKTLKSFGRSAWETVKNIDWANLGKTIINLIVNGLKSLVMAIPNALKSIGQSAAKAIKNISWLDIGKNIISGIAAGISGAASSIVDAAKNAAQSAFNAAKRLLGIASPSRVFRDKIGKMISLGLAEGIEENTAPISAAMDELTGMTAGAFSPEWTLKATENGTTGAYSGGDTMGKLVTLVSGLSAKLDRMEVRLDGRMLVGGLVDTMDQAFADRGALTARGAA